MAANITPLALLKHIPGIPRIARDGISEPNVGGGNGLVVGRPSVGGLEGLEREKIRQAVMVGSIFLALERGFCTATGVLQWLMEAEVTERTQIAYKALSMRIRPDQQYLDDGWHFLVKQPDYGYLALQLGLNPELPDRRKPSKKIQTQNGEGDEAEKIRSGGMSKKFNPIMGRIVEAYAEVINSQRSLQHLTLILNGSGRSDYLEINLTACYRARHFPHLPRLTPHTINTVLIEADWVEKLRYGDKRASLQLAQLILQRTAMLQAEAALYFAGVAYTVYHQLLVKLNQDKLLTNLSRDELGLLDTFFPDIIDRKILAYDDLTFKLSLLGNDIGGYILGFPIQSVIPNDAQIHSALAVLLQLGKQGYADQIRAFTTRNCIPALPIAMDPPTLANTTDVLMEDIDPYVSFDIVAYQEGSHLYRFTRPEFAGLLDSKKNPWTNNWFPPTILAAIKARVDAAKELQLPPARPLLEMLDRIETQTLFELDSVTPTPPLPTLPNAHLPQLPDLIILPPLPPVQTPTSPPIQTPMDELVLPRHTALAPPLVAPTLPNPLQAAINGMWIPGMPDNSHHTMPLTRTPHHESDDEHPHHHHMHDDDDDIDTDEDPASGDY